MTALADTKSRMIPPITPPLLREQDLLLPSEAERHAIDRTYAIAKESGALLREADRRALQQQINERGAA